MKKEHKSNIKVFALLKNKQKQKKRKFCGCNECDVHASKRFILNNNI